MKYAWRIVLLILASAFVASGLHAQLRIGFDNSSSLLRNPAHGKEFNHASKAFISPRDTTKKDTSLQKKHSPKTAALMSALCPGLGQIYNKKYWKLAIIYPAIGGLTYGFIWNQSYFKVYRDALRIRYDGDSTTIDQFSLYSDDRIVTMKNYYQRYRDLCVIGFAAVYVLQIIDAAVDAHLFYFDVGPDLSMRWSPKFEQDNYGFSYGAAFQLTLR